MLDTDRGTMDSCDAPLVLLGDKNTVNYNPCSVEVDCVNENSSPESEQPSMVNNDTLLPQNQRNAFWGDNSQELKRSTCQENLKHQKYVNDVVEARGQDTGGTTDGENNVKCALECDDNKIQSFCGTQNDDTGNNMTPKPRETSGDPHYVYPRKDEDESLIKTSAGRDDANSSCSVIDHELEASDEEPVSLSRQPIYMIGKNNVLNLFPNGKTGTSFNLEDQTEVEIEYKVKVRRITGRDSKEDRQRSFTRNVLIVTSIKDNSNAENAAFVAMCRRTVRQTLDTLFSVISHIIELVEPGSIVIEIKPTSQNSIRTLLESINNGKFDNIIKEILSQESVLTHIKGKKVSVKVELNIPEELLEKEGIVVIEDSGTRQMDIKSDLAVTVKDENFDDDISSQSSSVDPLDISTVDEGSSSVDPCSKSATLLNQNTPISPEVEQPAALLPVPSTTSSSPASQSSVRENIRRSKKLTQRSLKSLKQLDPSEIVITLHKKKKDFCDIISYKHNDTVTRIIASVLGKACKCFSMSQWLNELLTVVLPTSFLDKSFCDFVEGLDDSDMKLKEVIEDILPFLRAVLQRMPTEGWKKVHHIALLINGKWQRIKQPHHDINKDIERLFELIELTKPKISKSEQEGEEDVDDGFQTPPETFRKLPIIPLKGELDGSVDIFLLPNKVGKKFRDLEHYLECQFRLFRADVILPLKQNIEEFKTAQKTSTSYRVYSGVRILRPVCSENGLSYRIAFDPKPLQRVKWDTSQRLIFGSLLCFSPDKFTDIMLFATVNNREPASLKKGLVDVQFLSSDLNVTTLPRHLRFDMVESPAYFESYKDILKGMQTLNDRTLPFQEYIVECQNIVREPLYLQKQRNPQYDLRPLIDFSYKITEDKGVETFSEESQVAMNIPIQDKHSWPNIDDLDKSQLNALQNALTREFTLIHGPPGTGKTYLGIKILKVLLHNQQVWLQGQAKLPILIVCYTNHALDQFLEGILSTYKGKLLRVGGRIKSELLEQHSLKNARKRVKDTKTVPAHLFEAKMITLRAMNELKRDIDRTAVKIEIAEREIIHENCLKEIMSKRLEYFFSKRESHSNTPPTIVRWLGVDKQLEELDKETCGPEDVLELMEIDEDEDDTFETIDLPESRMSQRRLEEDVLDVFSDSESDDYRDTTDDLCSENRLCNIAVNVTSLDDYILSDFFLGSHRVANKEKMKRRRWLKTHLMKEIMSTDIMTESEEKHIGNIWRLTYRDRWRLYRYWVDLFCEKSKEYIRSKEEEYKNIAAKFKEILMQEDRSILQSCSVIGMTTTGAARYQKILNEIGPKIIVVEEAAEVLEAHVIGTLSQGCQHLILIGDHKQLRPNPTVHELAKKYSLEISLFERMVKSGIHCDMLEWQHRMRPEIADTIRSLYQDRLKDHDMVAKYGHVRGIASNMYFIEHQHKHDFDEETKSFLNEHEAEYLVALCKYLLKQGYYNHQITILTFYSAQVQCLRRKMPKSEFGGVKVVAVDSYQGEENDLILLSLVRSKTEGSIGFLKEENRICVALSRAKMGMYVIGNFTHIVQHCDLLKEICHQVNQQGKLGPALPLCCQRHPTENVVGAIDAADFQAAPEGGCTKPCDYRLPCGHVCPKVCHGNDPNHKEYICTKPCKKLCKHGHSNCTEPCYKPCIPCEEPVQMKLSQCGHIQNVPCHLDPSHYQCKEKCQEVLSCGHKCRGLCNGPHPLCEELIEMKLPCGHRSSVPCGQRNSFPCNSPCGATLQCEHQCQGTCGGCYQGRLHQPCKSKCKQILICGHECQSTCNLLCPPCERPCENRCSHSMCKKKCGELCASCKEPCDLKCRHAKCGAMCGSSCTLKRCNNRCKKRLPRCGHPCKGLCGETCPFVCSICNKDQVREIHSIFGTEDTASAQFIQLECGDMFEVTSLDKWMDATSGDENKMDVKLKECPRCQKPIRSSLRYANVIKQGLANIEKVKEKMKGNEENMKKMKETLENLKRQFRGQDKMMVQQLTQRDRVPSEIVLSTQINQLRILYQLSSLERMIKGSGDGPEESKKHYMILQRYITDFKEWVVLPRHCFSPQEIKDSRREMMRLSLLRFCIDAKHLIEIEKKDVPEHLKCKLAVLVQHLQQSNVLTDSYLHEARELKDELRVYLPQSQIGVSEEERLMIVEAVGLNRGHWYKCKEGHVYAIGECGRADEEAACPECGGAIGGVSHQLAEDNAWAPEMDDAEEPPWSEERDLEFALMLDRELNG